MYYGNLAEVLRPLLLSALLRFRREYAPQLRQSSPASIAMPRFNTLTTNAVFMKQYSSRRDAPFARISSSKSSLNFDSILSQSSQEIVLMKPKCNRGKECIGMWKHEIQDTGGEKSDLFHFDMPYYVCRCDECSKNKKVNEVEFISSFLLFATEVLSSHDDELSVPSAGAAAIYVFHRY